MIQRPMNKPDVVIRVDASLGIGIGHVMRCLSLADSLRERGAQVTFICRPLERNLISRITARKHRVLSLPEKSLSIDESGQSQAGDGVFVCDNTLDGTETAAALSDIDRKVEWLIVDHYGLDEEWERIVKPYAKKILVIDDLANRRHDCDMLLDQYYLYDNKDRYAGLVNDSCVQLLGAEYVVLSEEYRKANSNNRGNSGAIRNVFVFLGGGATYRFIEPVVRAILLLGHKDIEFELVLGAEELTSELEHDIISSKLPITIHRNLESLLPLMARADLALGAGGVNTWERLCLGLPSLVLTVAENQEEIAEYLHNNHYIKLLGKAGQVGSEEISAALSQAITEGVDSDWSDRCRRLIDGKGAIRVANAMMLDQDTTLCARKADPLDEKRLLDWANDRQTRKNALNSAQISLKEHKLWFTKRLDDKHNCTIYIVETLDNIAIGQVRFERHEEVAFEVHYSLDKMFRGRGVGSKLLATGIETFLEQRGPVGLVARVVKDNIPSHKIFKKLGFSNRAENPADEITRFER